jgi:hypothetical protein
MIFGVKIGNCDNNRVDICNMITKQKEQDPSFTVIDVGGSLCGWSTPYVDAIMDFNKPEVPTNVRVFSANLNKHSDWKEVLEYVETNGKFSYAICSHTLEDIANPTLAMDLMPQIAQEGYIAVPSKYRELSRGIEGPWRGYIHHRWIYDIQADKLVGFPKVVFLEHQPYLDTIADISREKEELCFQWYGSIDYEIINNDYIGPSVGHVIDYYKKLL